MDEYRMAAMAWQAAPGGLFKYRPYHREWCQWVDAMILKGEARFTPMGEFDDPFEGRPYAEAAHQETEKQLYASRRAHVRAQVTLRGASRKDAERQAALITAETLPQKVAQVEEEMRTALARDCQVFCLSATRELPMQWSLYANCHRGVCVHFNSAVEPVSIALPVTYSERYPCLPVPRFKNQTDLELVAQCALVKAKWWEHQQEFRLLRWTFPGIASADLGIPWVGQNGYLPLEAVSGITLGARVSEESRTHLVELCRARNPAIPVHQATLAEREFALKLERIG
jgi:hypothetical protein